MVPGTTQGPSDQSKGFRPQIFWTNKKANSFSVGYKYIIHQLNVINISRVVRVRFIKIYYLFFFLQNIFFLNKF
jgi:hypothetical protein